MKTHVLIITGPAGVGKSTLTWEISSRLAGSGFAHAVIDTDELDRVFPLPSLSELGTLRSGTTDVSSLTLAAIWSVYAALGHSRLIMAGVMVAPQDDRRWIMDAIPNAEIIFIRLLASEKTILSRLDKREVGSGREDQIKRSLEQAEQMRGEQDDELIMIQTDETTPAELADRVLRGVGWLQ